LKFIACRGWQHSMLHWSGWNLAWKSPHQSLPSSVQEIEYGTPNSENFMTFLSTWCCASTGISCWSVSVCLSHASIVSKRLNGSSSFLVQWLPLAYPTYTVLTRALWCQVVNTVSPKKPLLSFSHLFFSTSFSVNIASISAHGIELSSIPFINRSVCWSVCWLVGLCVCLSG